MKIYIGILIVLFSTIANGQILNGIVTDFDTNLPMHLANVTFIEKDKGTYTDLAGKFELKINNEKQILISSVGYKSLIVNISEIKDFEQIFNIKLKPSAEKLQEVVISAKNKKYTSSKKLGESKRLKIRTSLPFGYEFANLIHNPKNQEGIVKQVILNLNKSKEYDYLATYNIKFYEYDSITKEPGKLLHFKNLVINPENKTYQLKIDVEELRITFPKNGICIGVEIVNDKYDEPIKSMAIIAPRINFTHTDLKLLTWSRFRNKEWKPRTRKSQMAKGFINGLVKIMVKFEK